LKRGLADDVLGGGSALLVSSVATGLIGFAYWAIVARHFDQADVGRVAALLSAVMLAANLASAGAKRSVLRFASAAGGASSTLVLRIIGLAAGLGVVGGLVLLLVARVWSVAGVRSSDGPLVALGVVLAVPVWVAFSLQDAALVALRRPWWVPVGNVVFSVAKVGLVLALAIAGVGAVGAVLASWLVPAVVIATVVYLALLRKGRRRAHASAGGRVPPLRELLSFAAAEHAGVVIWRAAVLLLPVIVLGWAGAAAAAAYYVADQLVYGISLVSSNVTDAAVAAAARDEALLRPRFAQAARMTFLLVVPAAVCMSLLAGPVLELFGAGYRADATGLAVLMALAAIPNAVTTLVIGVAHVRKRVRFVLGLQVALSVALVAGALAGLQHGGLTAVGVGYLTAQLIVAVWAATRVRGLLVGPTAPAVSRSMEAWT
jgi:O-antigen/teichoic acid export membrane protein